MTKFHAVMTDETGCEFGVSVTARSRKEAYAKLKENYSESRVAQLESPADTLRRERRIERYAERMYDNHDGYCDDMNY